MKVEFWELRKCGLPDEDWSLITLDTDKVEFFDGFAHFKVKGKEVVVRFNEISAIYEDDKSAH